MKSQVKIGALLSYVVLALHNLVGLLYTPFMLRMMGSSEYGIYSVAASVVAYLTVLDLGFGNAIVRYTAKYKAEGKAEEQYKMFGMFFLLYCAIGLVALVAGGFVCLNAENIFDSAMTGSELYRMKLVLLLMVFNVAITFPLSIFGSIITAYEQFVFKKVVNIFRIVLNTATMVVLLYLGYRAVAMVVVTTLFNILSLGSDFWFCRYRLKIRLKFGKFQWGFLREVSIYSFWIFMNAIMDRFYWSSGQFVLGVFSGTAAVAVFAVAVQLLQMFKCFSIAISSLLLPKVTTMVVNDPSGKEVSDLFIRVGRVQYGVMMLILSGFFLFGRPFVRLWAGDGYDDAYIIVMIIFIPFFVDLIQNTGIVILQARNQMKFRSILCLMVSVVCVALQFPLAKYYGGMGCAIGIGAGFLLAQGLVLNVYYQTKQKINIVGFWMNILKMSVVPFFVCGTAYIILSHYAVDSVYKLALGIILYLLAYLPLFLKFSMNQYERDLVLKPVKRLMKRI